MNWAKQLLGSSDEKLVKFALAGWLILNLLQAYFTELFNDEAYYWVYSQNLDWGYFDHPPAIALIIKAGFALFKTELGVRLMVTVLSTISLYLVWRVCREYGSNAKLFCAVVFSMALVHVGGFIAAPDIPLILFTTLFFYFYRIYLNEDSLAIAVVLAAVIAAMLYSKYHGILVVFFTLLSNISLLKRKSFWLMLLVASFLFLPHCWWQYSHDLSTLRYHLFNRAKGLYEVKHTLNFIGGQLLMAGPLLGVIFIPVAMIVKPMEKFQRALKFTFVGMVTFFLLSSYKGRVEPHWMAAAYIPMMMLCYLHFLNKKKWHKALFICAVISFMLLVVVRIGISFPILPKDLMPRSETHGWKDWAMAIQKKAEGLPVIFMNSFQKAAKYSFYTREYSHSLNNVYYRKNQYDLWENEQEIQGKEVFYVQIYNKYVRKDDPIPTPLGNEYYEIVPNFRSYGQLRCTVDAKNIEMTPNEERLFDVVISNSSMFDYIFNANDSLPVRLCYTIEKLGVTAGCFPQDTLGIEKLNKNELFEQPITITAPAEPGDYLVLVSLKVGWMLPEINGEYIRLNVK